VGRPPRLSGRKRAASSRVMSCSAARSIMGWLSRGRRRPGGLDRPALVREDRPAVSGSCGSERLPRGPADRAAETYPTSAMMLRAFARSRSA
jgi:hypothetical protein